MIPKPGDLVKLKSVDDVAMVVEKIHHQPGSMTIVCLWIDRDRHLVREYLDPLVLESYADKE